MYSASSVLYRHWLILSKIPRYPRTVTTKALQSFLATHGFEVSRRMVQRDVESLSASELFPLTSELQGKSNVWYWPPGATLLSLPVMDISVALTFSLAQAYSWPM